MSRFLSTLVGFAAVVFCIMLGVAMLDAISNPTYQDALTARYEARQQTERVRAEQWGETTRTLGTWGAGALVIVAVAGVGGWAVVEWQRERSRRHVASVGAQERVILAYIAAYGGRAGQLGGEAGVFLDASREFIPWKVARAELPARALLGVDAHPDSR